MVIKLFLKQNSSHFRLAGVSTEAINYYDDLKLLEKPTNVKSAGRRGRGLFANVNIKKYHYIVEYVGELVTPNEYNRRYLEYKNRGYKHDYFSTMKIGKIIDATMVGNNGRYANHSCDPNSEFVYEDLPGSNETVMFIAATRRIREGEEITIDYAWFKSETSVIDLNECNCGSKNCRGYI